MNNPPENQPYATSLAEAGNPKSFHLLGLVIAVSALMLMGLLQLFAPSLDHQLVNIASAILVLFAAITLLVWWIRNISPTILKWGVPAIAFVALVGFLVVFEFTSFSGELVPQFRNRYAARPALPTLEDANSQLDQGTESAIVIEAIDYPRFLGPEANGRLEAREFSKDWETNQPRLVWSHPVGKGLAGIAVATLRIGDVTEQLAYTIEQRDQDEVVVCYQVDTGEMRWFHSQTSYHYDVMGDTGPRSTPTVSADGLVYAQGATGNVWCLDAMSGKLVWETNLLSLAGIDQQASENLIKWGRSGSPLLVDDLVVVPLGGPASSPDGSPASRTLIAFDAKTGIERWRGGEFQISYASPVLATLAGFRQIVSVNEDYVSGHAIESGETLWFHDWPGQSNSNANCSNPTLIDGEHVLLSKGYGGGASLLRLQDGKAVEEVWRNNRLLKTKFTNPVAVGDSVYGISDGSLECVDWQAGESRWKQPRRSRCGHGHITVVEDCIIASTEEGEIVLIDLNPDEYVELGRFQAVEGKTWNPATIIGNRILVRNTSQMALWELPSK